MDDSKGRRELKILTIKAADQDGNLVELDVQTSTFIRLSDYSDDVLAGLAYQLGIFFAGGFHALENNHIEMK